jgi:hypothetical protein
MAEPSIPDDLETCLARAIESLTVAALACGDCARLTHDRSLRDAYTAQALDIFATLRDLRAGTPARRAS